MRLRSLGLRFDADRIGPDDPVVTVLIDGRDLVAGTRLQDRMGFDPSEILGDGAPLLPTDPARRVAVYRCGCTSAGCGCVAPLISRLGDQVIWSDARDFIGVYTGPTVEEMPSGGRALRIADLRFDAEQYEAEVRRASLDRSWESDRRITARLLEDHLAAERAHLLALGYRLEWTFHTSRSGNAFQVSLLDDEGCQVVLDVDAPEQAPEPRAAELAARVLMTDPDDWDVVFWGDPPPEPDEEPG